MKSSSQNLKFRRQFLLSPKVCHELEAWKREKRGENYLYVHPDCAMHRSSKENTDVILIGYLFNPNKPDKTDQEIIDEIAVVKSVEEVSEYLYPLVGRFVMILNINDSDYVFNDACGLRAVCYTYEGTELYLASQPNLLKLVTDLKEGKRYNDYYESDYVKENKEHFIPCGITLFPEVQQLVPNHYLDVSAEKQIRFWPNKIFEKQNLDVALKKFAKLLGKTMKTASSKYDLAVSLTAGLDSRIILSACKDIAKDVEFYTLQYRKLSKKSKDITVPQEILSSFGYRHTIVECRDMEDDGFLKIYENNSSLAHTDDWGNIALGILTNFPSGKMAVKGSCAEIGQNECFKNGIHPKHLSAEILLGYYGWGQIDFARAPIQKWLDEVSDESVNFGYYVLDLFYWDQRVVSSQAQCHL